MHTHLRSNTCGFALLTHRCSILTTAVWTLPTSACLPVPSQAQPPRASRPPSANALAPPPQPRGGATWRWRMKTSSRCVTKKTRQARLRQQPPPQPLPRPQPRHHHHQQLRPQGQRLQPPPRPRPPPHQHLHLQRPRPARRERGRRREAGGVRPAPRPALPHRPVPPLAALAGPPLAQGRLRLAQGSVRGREGRPQRATNATARLSLTCRPKTPRGTGLGRPPFPPPPPRLWQRPRLLTSPPPPPHLPAQRCHPTPCSRQRSPWRPRALPRAGWGWWLP